jgi:hypothetical protein
MNTKQLASVVMVVAIVLMFQLGLSLRNRATMAAAQADGAIVEANKLRTQFGAEEELLADLRSQSKDLTEFVAQWEPYFAILEEQESAETSISMNVRAADMLNLSQRYEQVPHTINNKRNDSLPLLVRATLVFDDSYSKLLNWMGMMEKIKPTMRVGRVVLARGSRGKDLKMELVLEVPLRAKNPKKK